VRVLSVNVDQQLADLAQLGDGCGMRLDERPRAAAGVDDPPHKHIPGSASNALRSSQACAPFVPRGETRRSPRACLQPGRTDCASAALAEHQRQRIDENRFARAGSPVSTLKPLEELELRCSTMTKCGW
jgi:hypothetical protein